VKKTVQFLCLLILGSATVFAQTVTGSQVVYTEKSAVHVPAQEVPAGLKVIYSDLGTKTDSFNDSNGWLIAGPNSTFAQSSLPEYVAMAFTPKADASVTQVEVAVMYIGSGANQVNLSIYQDSGSGYPGTLLAGPVTVTNLTEAGTCCTLTIASFTPVAVSAGTQYWVTADTPLTGTGSDFEGVWNWDVKNMGDYSNGTPSYTWILSPVDGVPAGEVLGTIP